jgi:hypothetical protein
MVMRPDLCDVPFEDALTTTSLDHPLNAIRHCCDDARASWHLSHAWNYSLSSGWAHLRISRRTAYRYDRLRSRRKTWCCSRALVQSSLPFRAWCRRYAQCSRPHVHVVLDAMIFVHYTTQMMCRSACESPHFSPFSGFLATITTSAPPPPPPHPLHYTPPPHHHHSPTAR